jgi:hypothetical protein
VSEELGYAALERLANETIELLDRRDASIAGTITALVIALDKMLFAMETEGGDRQIRARVIRLLTESPNLR